MKNKLKILEVDSIGGQKQPLTKEEEMAISNFIKTAKVKNLRKTRINLKSKLVSKQVNSL
ncbi:MAG: hypothetical protein B7X72_01290 [Sphingobacteriia bacterium 39-39-8]|nr:MAG: hypothetical protein B7X72_01290 [Sphingobacteriia bacterium 39-39-8]